MKPELRLNVDLTTAETGGLIEILQRTVELKTYEDNYNLRKPLGVYNISILRMDMRLCKLATAVQKFTSSQTSIERSSSGVEDDISESIEAVIYAAAEHVDDLESCLKCFFPSAAAFANSKIVKTFKSSLKHLRRNPSAYANAIKHQQARVRIYEMEFVHSHKSMVMLGFFIEGVWKGEVGPSLIVHGTDIRVVSVPALLWELLIFVEQAADVLAIAVSGVLKEPIPCDDRQRFPILTRALPELARIPNYNFDGAHPFERTNIKIEGEERSSLFSSSDLYGSLGNRWSTSEEHSFGGTAQMYQGDGVTKQFKLSDPKQIQLQHWRDG